MTAENNFNVKPLTNIAYVAPANPSGEQPGPIIAGINANPAQKEDEPKQTIDDNGEDMQHVIDYRA